MVLKTYTRKPTVRDKGKKTETNAGKKIEIHEDNYRQRRIQKDNAREREGGEGGKREKLEERESPLTV